MISGHATFEGTQEFSKNSGINSENFKEFENLFLSNVGIGTYLGDPDAKTDELVKNAVISMAAGFGGLYNGLALDSLKGIAVLRKFLDNIRFFEFTEEFLKLSIKNAEGRITGTLTWRKLQQVHVARV